MTPNPSSVPDYRPTGDLQEISSDTQIRNQLAMDREIAEATRRREHYWVAIVSFKVTPPMRDGSLLDRENIRGVPGVGCYICEATYREDSPARCPGEPS